MAEQDRTEEEKRRARREQDGQPEEENAAAPPPPPALRRRGRRPGAGADTPSGPDSDRTMEAAKREQREKGYRKSDREEADTDEENGKGEAA